MLATVALSGAMLAGAPGAAATRVCPGTVVDAYPETPHDAVNSIVEARTSPDGVVAVCYDPAVAGCTTVAVVRGCASQSELARARATATARRARRA